MKRFSLLTLPFLCLLFSAAGCGGGGSGSDGNSSGVLPGEGSAWRVEAAVTKDGCGERISPVTQTFLVNLDGSSVSVNTSIVNLSGTRTDDGFTAGFSESNGDCDRNYTIEFTSFASTTANAKLTASSTCNGSTCENEWIGSATKIN